MEGISNFINFYIFRIFNSYEEIEAAFAKGEETLHPGDLKEAVAKYINKML
jgi:hypothetical protein